MQWGGCFVKPYEPVFTVQDVVETAVEVGDDGCCCYLCGGSRGGGEGRGGSSCDKEGEGEGEQEEEGGQYVGNRLLGRHSNQEPEDNDAYAYAPRKR